MGLVIDQSAESRSGNYTSVVKNRIWTMRRTFKREFIVISDYMDEDETSILSSVGIPPINSYLQGAVCVSQDAEEEEPIRWYNGTDQMKWKVVCGFDSDRDTSESEQPPTARTPEVDWSTSMSEENMPQDVNGNYVANSVGDRIDVRVPRANSILEIRRYEAYPYNPNTLLFYGGCVNDSVFYGAPRGSVFMEAIQSTKTEVDGAVYSNTTYRMNFKLRYDASGNIFPDSWVVFVPNTGFSYLKTAGDMATKTRITDDEGGQKEDWLELDGTIRPGPPTNDFPVQLQFPPYFYRNFSALSLGPY